MVTISNDQTIMPFGGLIINGNLSNKGMLTVSDGTHTANVAMAGQYDAAGFQVAANADGSAVITYLLQQNQPVV